MQKGIVTVVGGSGFVGHHVVRALADAGYTVNVLCRDTVAAAALRTAGTVGQIVLQYADITQPETLKSKFEGSLAVVNLVSTLVSRGRQNFKALNVDGVAHVAAEAKRAGVERFVHVSALGVERAQDTQYGATKKQGEDALRSLTPGAVILRPSLIFGTSDGFFERFARMSSISPALPLIGGGATKFQPVYVGDVARAVLAALENPKAAGNIYELAGPQRYSFKALLELLLTTTKRKRILISIPFFVARIMAMFAEFLPSPPMTRDQVKLLAHDNVLSGANGLESLGITPTTLEAHLPQMLARYVVA